MGAAGCEQAPSIPLPLLASNNPCSSGNSSVNSSPSGGAAAASGNVASSSLNSAPPTSIPVGGSSGSCHQHQAPYDLRRKVPSSLLNQNHNVENLPNVGSLPPPGGGCCGVSQSCCSSSGSPSSPPAAPYTCILPARKRPRKCATVSTDSKLHVKLYEGLLIGNVNSIRRTRK